MFSRAHSTITTDCTDSSVSYAESRSETRFKLIRMSLNTNWLDALVMEFTNSNLLVA